MEAHGANGHLLLLDLTANHFGQQPRRKVDAVQRAARNTMIYASGLRIRRDALERAVVIGRMESMRIVPGKRTKSRLIRDVALSLVFWRMPKMINIWICALNFGTKKIVTLQKTPKERNTANGLQLRKMWTVTFCGRR